MLSTEVVGCDGDVEAFAAAHYCERSIKIAEIGFDHGEWGGSSASMVETRFQLSRSGISMKEVGRSIVIAMQERNQTTRCSKFVTKWQIESDWRKLRKMRSC